MMTGKNWAFLAVALLGMTPLACGESTDDEGMGGLGGGHDHSHGGATATGGTTSATGGSAGGTSADGCSGLCEGAGYSGGDEVDFGNGLIECTCSGTGDAVTQEDCNAYCSTFDVAADKSYLSMENGSVADKCVCDGL